MAPDPSRLGRAVAGRDRQHVVRTRVSPIRVRMSRRTSPVSTMYVPVWSRSHQKRSRRPPASTAATIRRLARELAAAPTAAVYGRIGTTTTEFGTTTSWLIDVVNVLTGNLDRAGGSMFPMPVAGGPSTRGGPRTGPGFRIGRGHSRVSGRPEVAGEYPAAVLAEEILTPGEGRVRSLVTVGGNPMLSTPNGNQLADAFADLEFMVSIDMYLNETTKYADVVLPVPSQLERSHYDMLLLQFAVRNVANYSGAVLPLEPGVPDEWEVMAKLTLIAQGLGVDADVSIIDDLAIAALGAQCRR